MVDFDKLSKRLKAVRERFQRMYPCITADQYRELRQERSWRRWDKRNAK